MLKLMHQDHELTAVAPGAAFSLPNGDIVSPAYAGWTNEDGYALVPSDPPPAPSEAEVLAEQRSVMRVSRFQARAALLAVGLLDQVEAAVAGADPFTRLAWADATEFQRNSPTIGSLAAAVGLDDAALDQLFHQAAQISA